ncbi:MAG: DUF305 domain-containing protein [Candidatus Saccharimonadales bacterium]
MKKNNIIIVAIIAIVAIAGVSIYAISKNNDNGMMDDNMISNHSSQQSATGSVDKNSSEYKIATASLKVKTMTRCFITNMITHHQGAVDMANLA